MFLTGLNRLPFNISNHYSKFFLTYLLLFVGLLYQLRRSPLPLVFSCISDVGGMSALSQAHTLKCAIFQLDDYMKFESC